MPHARLTHNVRPTLQFLGGQNSETSREAVANITNELATDRDPLVHTETRDVRETERGTATGLRRADNDPDTSDPYQALANYAVELEAHVDEFQGADPAYSYVNDQTGVSQNAILESIEWSLTPGKRYELDYEASVVIGRGVFEERDINPTIVSVGGNFDAMLRVDGVECPGMRDYRVEKALGVNPKGIFNRDTAENNDVLIEEGASRVVAFEGVHTGTRTERENADNALSQLVGTKENVTLDTQFPGYSFDGYVIEYSSTFEQNRSFDDSTEGSHRYRLQFAEGQRA
jgi:hypothetical protein